ncbi:disulfide bond formation protein B [Nitratireductor sp. CAU 1489]|uniref:Disulfide bond formation protein B n=1 Tax=Nitratireductor arenosus TaxID=2682096 RepID=A0A844QAX1_9HYPH|nr:disulfide bond formation protein B [Nitratireductor arenosus]MVA96087.1 disulfide bond formation protein B [Nitratireductor arenosus]
MTTTMTNGSNRLAATAFFLLAAMAVVVGAALGFEHLGGYIPCKLCLEQRMPYYIGAPLMAVAGLAALMRAPGWIARLLIAAGGLLMVYGLYLAVYHSGVEWGWWAGPADCGAVAAPPSSEGGILDAINTVIPPSCDKASLRVLGLSFAGWNAIASLMLAAAALRAAIKGAPDNRG